MAYTTINKPTDYFNTVLYTGNGTDGRTITGVGFQPDWVWIKDRSVARSHVVQDSVRGFNDGNKVLRTNGTDSESGTDNDVFGYVGNTNSDGYTLEDGTTDGRYVNNNTETYASWNWLAGGTGVSNTDGSITSTVSANTTSGFSIVSYTGTGSNATVGHGLGVAPKIVIIKDRDAATDWAIYHGSLGATKFIELNTTVASQTNNTAWNDTEPTSSVFSIGTGGIVNTSSRKYIAYCFAEIKGYSKFGSYTGNGDADGSFIYTGFKPAFVMIKRTSGVNSWNMIDNKREGYNPQNDLLFPDSNNDESDVTDNDILSNGFKLRTTGSGRNASGETYIFMAFAENPLVGTNNIPATAR